VRIIVRIMNGILCDPAGKVVPHSKPLTMPSGDLRMPAVQSVPRPMLENYLRQLFAIGDAKHNGFLAPNEISDLLSRSGFKLPEHVIKKLVAEAVLTAQGKIEYEEFIPALVQLASEPPEHLEPGGFFDDPRQVQQWTEAAVSDMQMRAKIKELWKDGWREKNPSTVKEELLVLLQEASIHVTGRVEYIETCVCEIQAIRQKSHVMEQQAKELVRQAKDESEKKARDSQAKAAKEAEEKMKRDEVEAKQRQKLIDELVREEEKAAAKVLKQKKAKKANKKKNEKGKGKSKEEKEMDDENKKEESPEEEGEGKDDLQDDFNLRVLGPPTKNSGGLGSSLLAGPPGAMAATGRLEHLPQASPRSKESRIEEDGGWIPQGGSSKDKAKDFKQRSFDSSLDSSHRASVPRRDTLEIPKPRCVNEVSAGNGAPSPEIRKPRVDGGNVATQLRGGESGREESCAQSSREFQLSQIAQLEGKMASQVRDLQTTGGASTPSSTFRTTSSDTGNATVYRDIKAVAAHGIVTTHLPAMSGLHTSIGILEGSGRVADVPLSWEPKQDPKHNSQIGAWLRPGSGLAEDYGGHNGIQFGIGSGGIGMPCPEEDAPLHPPPGVPTLSAIGGLSTGSISRSIGEDKESGLRLMENALRCPISRDRISDPVIAGDGHTYDRMSITEWLERNPGVSPITSKQMSNFLAPNHSLVQVLEAWTMISGAGRGVFTHTQRPPAE